MNVTIKSIDTMPELDPYQRDTGQSSYTSLWLDPQERVAVVSQEYRTNSTTFDIWHNREFTFKINGHPKAESLKEYLESEDVQTQLAAICDGHSVNWDGRNMVGHLTEAADESRFWLEQNLAEYYDGSEWSFWQIEDWLQYGVDELSANTTDEEIKAMAKDIKSNAKSDDVILNGDVEEYLTDLRNEMIEDAE